MKKGLLTLIAGLLISFSCFAQIHAVTFQVHNPAGTPVYVFGNWNGWSNWPGHLMSDIGNGYYAVTLQLTGNTTYEYLFVQGSTPEKEILDPSWSCTNGNPVYTNRVLNVGNTDLVACNDWASCNTCTVVTTNVAVTFRVHNPATTPAFVFGSWSNWGNWPGDVMTDLGNGTWEATVVLNTSTAYEYLFVAGSTPQAEVLDPSWACTNGNTQNTNRTLTTGNLNTILCYDWASCNACAEPLQVDLPVTFDNANVNYAVVDFGGNYSEIVADPANASNLVCKSIKGATAELWAGTTVGAPAGFANAVPFAPNATTLMMKVYAPAAGIPVRMKVEDPNDPTKSVETEAVTTTSNNWEMLEFNFANQASGTQPINFSWTYKKLSVFFNFGTPGAVSGEQTYYFDDIEFGGITPPTTVNVTFRVQNPATTPVYVFGSWSGWVNWPGEAMTPVGDNTYEKTIELNASSTYEYLYVNGDTPAKETLNPAWSCTNGNFEYTNRVINTGTGDMVSCNQWGTCDPCGIIGPTEVSITFRVHNPANEPVFVFGSWSGWGNWPGNPMTNIGNNTYEATILLSPETTYEYLFVNGTEPLKETLDASWPCTNGNWEYTNRIFTTGTTNATYCFDWASCASCDGVTISGNLTYLNSVSTPMTNSNVYLVHGTDTLAGTTTSMGGEFTFGSHPGGNYLLKTKTTKAWGGGNATDALLVLKQFVGSIPQTGLALKACDVDGSGFVNSADALTVMKRFVGLQSTFPAGDWAFEIPTVSSLSGNPVNQAYHALCFGDVNGSFIPELMEQPTINLIHQGSIAPDANGIVEIPVSMISSESVAAISLSLKAQNLEILDVVPSVNLQKQTSLFISNAEKQSLTIAWTDATQAVSNGLLITVRAKLTGTEPFLSIQGNSSLAGTQGENVLNATLQMPKISASQGLFISSFSPNPCSNSLSVGMIIPENGTVRMTITDLLGQKVSEVLHQTMESGNHLQQIDVSWLNSGMYLMNTTYIVNRTIYSRTDRIVKQ